MNAVWDGDFIGYSALVGGIIVFMHRLVVTVREHRQRIVGPGFQQARLAAAGRSFAGQERWINFGYSVQIMVFFQGTGAPYAVGAAT